MNVISARSRAAPAPQSTAKRAPATLAGALEVEDAERRAEVPVGLRLEVEARRLAPAALDAVGALVRPDRDARVRQVGDRELERPPPRRPSAAASSSAAAMRVAELGHAAAQPLRLLLAGPAANSAPTSLEPRLRSAFSASSSTCASRQRASAASSSSSGASLPRAASAVRIRSGEVRHSSRASMDNLQRRDCWPSGCGSQPGASRRVASFGQGHRHAAPRKHVYSGG